MSSGVPVVATDIPGVKDCLGSGAYLVPAEAPIKLAEAAERLLTDGDAWKGERDRALGRAAMFSWDAVAEYIRGIYMSLQDGASASGSSRSTERWVALP
jgi:glycosyltransferase involved in cell wall biosynthesis